VTDRVLVTGAAGFVGRHLVPALVEEGASVVATDVEPEPPDTYVDDVGKSVDYRQGDITDEATLDDLLAPDYDRVFHLAAVVGVNDYVDNPLSLPEVNVVATKRILERVAGTDCRFVFTSTSEVYGRNPDVPWGEDDDRVLGPPTVDRWSYSTSKSLCEHMIHGLTQTDRRFEATVVRPFNLYGPGQRPDFVAPAFVEAVVNDESPIVYDEGDQTRCFTYIDDFVEGLLAASTKPAAAGEAFNLGNDTETTIRDLAEIVLEVAGRDDLNPEFIDTEELYGDSYEDLQRRVPETSKAREILDWQAETPLETGIERLLNWGREHY